MNKFINKLFFILYQVLRAIRHTLIRTTFGYVSPCKHSPTCGTYMLRMWEKEGWVGALKGARRIASCW